MEATSAIYASLAINILLTIERIVRNVKRIKSSCCECEGDDQEIKKGKEKE